MSALDEHLKKHRQRIIDREEKTFRELLAAYDEVEKELKKSFDELQRKIEEAQTNGETISPSWFYRQKRLKNLLAQVQQQIVRFGGKVTKMVEREQRAAIDIAVAQAQETYKLLSENSPNVRDLGSTLNPRTVETAVGMMGDGSPIIEYFQQRLAPMVADKIKSEVIRAAAIGTDFRTISRRLQETGGITKHHALSVARTEVNRVRRETTRMVYEENSDIIEAWEWVASKSTRTCPLCLAMDGEIFELKEPFPQHINCRCTLIAVIEGLPRRPRTIGKEWFEKQSDETKAQILGKETFAAYRDNDLSLNDFVAFRNDKRFGKSVTRKPLAKILADKGISDNSDDDMFNPQNIKVTFLKGTKEKLQILLGKDLSDNEVGAMVGALSDAEVMVAFDSRNRENLYFNIRHPFISQQQRTLGADNKQRLYIYNDYFRTSGDAPKGVGLISFGTQAVNAKKMGVQYIHTEAAGEPGNNRFNGYYTWARMGYNAPLTDEMKQRLPAKYQNMKDLNELMLSGGKDDWKQFGSKSEMLFDLSDDSRSWKVLKNYLLERGFVVRF